MNTPYNKYLDNSEGPVLCIEVRHPVSYEQYTTMYIPSLTERYKKYGEVRVLYYYPEPDKFPGWEPEAAEEDLKNFTTHGKAVTKIALINAPYKVAQRWDLMSPLLGGPVREFEDGEFDEALAWIKS